MRLSEARCALGRRVTYTPADGGDAENGTILRCDGTYVYMAYPGGAKAVSADDLEFA